MASKLLNLVALSSLAIMACTFGAQPANALSHAHINHNINRHLAHTPIAKKKRDTKRCKARPSTSSAAPSTTPQTSSVKPQAAVASSKAPAPATTTKAAPPATTTQASSGGNSGSSGTGAAGNSKFGQRGSKVCNAWGNGNDPSLAQFKTEHVVGLYDWGVDKPANADKLGYDFWPMLWGSGGDKISAFESAVKPGLGTIILGFNEPNEQGQSNMDPSTAASLWKQHIEPKRDMGYKLCSPAMSSRPNGHQWMKDFMAACDGCHVDYQCVHWYDIGIDTLKSYLNQYHEELGLPILLTEFADQNFNGGSQATSGEIFDFMSSALEFFDNTDWILAACAFGVMHDLQGVNPLNLLQKSDGSPTDLGWKVINNSY
ncbi:glycosyl hydrolase catalytic core-domain-containing protein [Trametes gibbosa]|nr:glycosyl hydrolase catalytic core-domain-containing protein [Trametes gibbosa]